MNETPTIRRIVELSHEVSHVPIDEVQMQRALRTVRSQLSGQPVRAPRTTRRLLILSGAIAAALALCVLPMVLLEPRHLSAAEVLQESAQVTQAYRGWVHVTPTPIAGTAPVMTSQPAFPGMQPTLKAIHINTTDGTTAIVFEVLGNLGIQMFAPAEKKQFLYIGLVKLLRITPTDADMSANVLKKSAELPLKLADILLMLKAAGVQAPEIVETADHELQRFDLTFKDDPQKVPEQYRALATGKQTIWVDPATKLIRKMVTPLDGRPMLMEYSYGDPKIHDIYDLGVPRTAKVIEEVDTTVTGPDGKPAVFKLPDITRLTKDASADANVLLARIQKRIDANFGDYTTLECDQIKSLGRGGHEEGSIRITSRLGDKKVSAEYLVAPMAAIFGGVGFPTGWPQPKLVDALSAVQSATPVGLSVFDGEDLWNAGMSDKGLKIDPATRPAGNIPRPQSGLGAQFWQLSRGMSVTINGKSMGGSQSEILRDPNHPDLIVLHGDTTLPFKMPGATADYHMDALYWIDPAHDDLCVESLTRDNTGGTELGSIAHEITLEFARLKDNRWYPAHWQHRHYTLPSATQPAYEDTRYLEYWRQVFAEPLPTAWYENPAKRLRQGATIFTPATLPTQKP